MKDKKDNNIACPRLGTVGGQAVIEGVMMKSADRYSVACRLENGRIRVVNREFRSVRSKHKLFNLPIIRGVVNMIEMMKLSYETLGVSADAMGIDDIEAESKFEKWMKAHLGGHIVDIIMGIAMVFGLAIGIGLFFFLPIWATKGIEALAGGNIGWIKNLVEGIIKIIIFIGYLSLVSCMKDIRRTFEYHGAEHKTIFCYEAGEELTPENVKKYKRFHPRCGTSFLFVMLILSIIIYSFPFVTWDNVILRALTKIVILPLIIGIGYEFIRFAGRHDNAFVRALSAPGLWMQRLTTREPDDSEIECAITALKCALPEVFPDFTLAPELAEEQKSADAQPSEPQNAKASNGGAGA
ncbi:MAG: DUF1385 domain-containing protein [Eubacteriales bacterium]